MEAARSMTLLVGWQIW